MDSNIKALYSWVEGDDDERFIKKIVYPIVLNKYSFVADPVRYSEEKNEKIENYVSSIISMQSDYIFLTDINSCNCYSEKKAIIIREYKSPESNRIIIVKPEIEAWYYAGLTDEICQEWKIPVMKTTNDLTKEKFNQIFDQKIEPRVVKLNKILDNYSIQTAKQKNTSFNYLCDKLGQ